MVPRTRDCRLPLRESTQRRLFPPSPSPHRHARGGFPVDTLYPCCAGLDIHKETVVACIRKVSGGTVRKEVRTFRTETSGLLALADWLTDEGVTHAAMESTGVYWKPVWNILEGVLELLLVNAEHIKQVPGRKTDVKDAEWIAQLLACGLLKASFVPERPVRDLRDLTRQRVQLVRQKVQVANRIQKTADPAPGREPAALEGQGVGRARPGGRLPDQKRELYQRRVGGPGQDERIRERGGPGLPPQEAPGPDEIAPSSSPCLPCLTN